MMLDELPRERRGEILRIASKYGARNVRVFGSAAVGESRGEEESDLDLLVEFESSSGAWPVRIRSA